MTQRARSRGRRPQPEALEARQLMAASLRGVDIDGDVWVLRLVGAGDLRVTLQPNSNGDPPRQGQPALIDTITIAGTDPMTSRLVGTVRRGPNGDGKVFFNTMEQLGGVSPKFTGHALGLNVIDMPHFWLGQTGSGTGIVTPSIDLPFGVNTLRFGGADVRYAAPGATPPNQDNQADTFTIDIGLPFTYGTSIIVDQIITDAQPGATGRPAIQDAVQIDVSGRLNTFQANAIRGNAGFPTTGLVGGGGTILRSIPDQTVGITGQIGFVRVGGTATNFGVQTNDRISNLYIGGETSHVFILAPEGSRHLEFGLGMDQVTIRSLVIETLQANRGAIGSDVKVADKIGRITIGGDVVNTTVLAGLALEAGTIFQTQTDPGTANAKSTGAIQNVLIAGDVTNSIFAAAVEPFEGQYDSPQALFFPHGVIKAKVEGRINNTDATPDKPREAFYAKTVVRTSGPVAPPNVVVPPFPHPHAPPRGSRVSRKLQPTVPPRRVRPAPTPTAQTRLADGATADPAPNV